MARMLYRHYVITCWGKEDADPYPTYYGTGQCGLSSISTNRVSSQKSPRKDLIETLLMASRYKKARKEAECIVIVRSNGRTLRIPRKEFPRKRSEAKRILKEAKFI